MDGDGKSLSNDFESARGDRADGDSERGKRASFDPKTGEVHGSGSGAGGEGNPGEDYDKDPMAGAGAEPLKGPRPASDSAKRAIDPDEGV
jgi:hypothetical protein